jgi:YegS/Rv2252/BmrU family lipid kinase
MPQVATQPEIFIILNPNAAKGRALRQRDAIQSFFTNRSIPFRMVLTEHPMEAIALSKDAVLSGYRTIIAAGGDGTVNEVVEGTMKASRSLGLSLEESPVIGLIPIGRGNDFAYFAGIPKGVEEACQLIVSNAYDYIDYGEVWGGRFDEGRCFVNGVGIGFDSLVNFVASDFKHVSGMLSYLLGFLKILVHYPEAQEVEITSEHGSFSCQTQQISLCNGRRMGSTFIMGPYAELDDGLLDVVYANRPIAGKEILRYAVKFLSGSQLDTDRFSMFRATDITITAKEDVLVCQTDGEEVSRGCKSIRVKLFPKGLKCIRNF